MTAFSSPWTVRSNPIAQLAASAAIAIAGLVLVCGFWSMANGNAKAGFALGVLLLAIGGWGLLCTARIDITVDPMKRLVIIESVRGTSRKVKRTIKFDEIASTAVVLFSVKSESATKYYVQLKLKNGKDAALYFGFFEGSSDRGVMEERCKRIEADLQRSRTLAA